MKTIPSRDSWRIAAAGFTLVELAISVSLAGVLMGGVIFYAQQTIQAQNVQLFGRRLGRLINSIDDIYTAQSDYSGLNVPTAIQLGLMQREIIDTSVVPNRVSHSFGRSLTLGTPVNFSNLAIGLHYTGLPGNACIDIVGFSLASADAVAVVADVARVSQLVDWSNTILPDGANTRVRSFPAAYEAIKTARDSTPTPAQLISACDKVTSSAVPGIKQDFGLAIVRSKL